MIKQSAVAGDSDNTNLDVEQVGVVELLNTHELEAKFVVLGRPTTGADTVSEVCR
jgi:hypothetical protein